MSSDSAWEEWGARDPYFGVITLPQFRASAITPDALREFFESGRVQAEYVVRMCRRLTGTEYSPKRILDFGCGVGRVLVAFADMCDEVVGMDVASSMLAEARGNCVRRGVENALLVQSDDDLSNATGSFDLVHSSMVLQHIEVSRGRSLFKNLIEKVRPGGCGAIHITFAWGAYPETFGQPPPPQGLPKQERGRRSLRQALLAFLGFSTEPSTPAPSGPEELPKDPEMQMNYYNLSEVMFVMQHAGVRTFLGEFTDHGGALGVFLFFQRPVPQGLTLSP